MYKQKENTEDRFKQGWGQGDGGAEGMEVRSTECKHVGKYHMETSYLTK